jgi:hypothetical protein
LGPVTLKQLEEQNGGPAPHNTLISGRHDEGVSGGFYLVPVNGRPGEFNVIDSEGRPFGTEPKSPEAVQLEEANTLLQARDRALEAANEAAQRATEQAEEANERVAELEKQLAEQGKGKGKDNIPPPPPTSLPPLPPQ